MIVSDNFEVNVSSSPRHTKGSMDWKKVLALDMHSKSKSPYYSKYQPKREKSSEISVKAVVGTHLTPSYMRIKRKLKKRFNLAGIDDDEEKNKDKEKISMKKPRIIKIETPIEEIDDNGDHQMWTPIYRENGIRLPSIRNIQQRKTRSNLRAKTNYDCY